jgi:GNAT superfamily N-acetyltransferase
MLDVYVAAFAARCAARRAPGQAALDEPGIRGLLPCAASPLARLLASDDRGHDVLAGLLPDTGAGIVNVLAAAARCAELFDATWRAKPLTAMVCADLASVPALPLPDGLRLRPVRRLATDPPDGVPLEAAVAAAMHADPRITDTPDAFAAYLRALPPSDRLFAAVDRHGTVRATSGSGVLGTVASALFVDTDPAWRGRGIARAMTAAALRAARDAGARQGCLDATAEGLSIYRRLGFAALTPLTQFVRA